MGGSISFSRLSGDHAAYPIRWGIADEGSSFVGICGRTNRVCKVVVAGLAVLVVGSITELRCDGCGCSEARHCLDSECDMNMSDDEAILDMLGYDRFQKPPREAQEAYGTDNIVEVARRIAAKVNEQLPSPHDIDRPETT